MCNKVILVVFCICMKIVLISTVKYKTCIITEPDCPSISICSQRYSNDTIGDCICKGTVEFNPAYKNDTDYCIPKPVVLAATTAGSLQTRTDQTASAISQNQPPTSHNIIAGILIPMFLILFVIGAAYAIKRLHVIKRIRDMMAARRAAPFYEDVMLGNDNDDPPLI